MNLRSPRAPLGVTLGLVLGVLTGCKSTPTGAGREPSSSSLAAPASAPAAGVGSASPQAAASGVTDTLPTSAGPVTLTPIHHGTLAFGFQGKTLVVDPWTSAPPGALPKADLVLLTDLHPDHFDPAALELVRKDGTVLVVPEVLRAKLQGAKVLKNGERTTELGIEIEAVPMYNLKRGPEAGKLYHDKGRGNGYVLGFADKRVYVSGDTECIDEMKALERIDLALVCMNLPFTMTPEEAASCVSTFKPKVVIPYHYRGSDLSVFSRALAGVDGVDVRVRDFYPARASKK